MIPQSNDRRQCTRMPFVTMVLIDVELEGVQVEADLQNISISGMYVELEQGLSLGMICSIRIFIKGRHSRLVLDEIEGEVIRIEEGGMAIRFTSHMEWFTLFNIYSQYAGKELQV